jgi:hypothetical protein
MAGNAIGHAFGVYGMPSVEMTLFKDEQAKKVVLSIDGGSSGPLVVTMTLGEWSRLISRRKPIDTGADAA